MNPETEMKTNTKILASKAEIIKALSYIDIGRYDRHIEKNSQLVELAMKQGFEKETLNWSLDKWFHSDKRPSIEGVDFYYGWFSDENPNGQRYGTDKNVKK